MTDTAPTPETTSPPVAEPVAPAQEDPVTTPEPAPPAPEAPSDAPASGEPGDSAPASADEISDDPDREGRKLA